MTDTQTLARDIEALLFIESDSITLKKLTSIFGCDDASLQAALAILTENLAQHGVALVRTDTEVALAVSPESREGMARILAREYERDIGDAGLEIIAVILYEGPSTRATIDYIRGVNSASTLRTLLARGLVERMGNPEDGREYVYRPSVELLAHLGVTGVQDLPEYATIAGELAAFKARQPIFNGTESGTEESKRN